MTILSPITNGLRKNSMDQPISIMAFPHRGNSYTECFYGALEIIGVKVVEGTFAGRWLLENLHGIEFVHLHWPSFFYNRPNPLRCLRQFALFVFFLALLRWRRISLVWTVHNLLPHDECVVPKLHWLVRQILVRASCLLPVHGRSAESIVLRAFPAARGRTVVIDHGHWIGYYPDTISRSEARKSLSLGEKCPVFLFMGTCKPYKNLEGLIDAFSRLPGAAKLVIAGRFQNPNYESAIRAAIATAPDRIRLHSGFVPDEDVQIFLRACDFVVMPYKEILTSGSAMLALSFGRPVVAPAIGFLKDVIEPGCGILYDTAERDGLPEAMGSAIVTKFDEAEIIAQAKSHDWKKSARIFAEALMSSCGHCTDRRD